MPDGSIHYLHRQSPHKSLDGYIVDPNDPYIFLPVIPPCLARTTRRVPCKRCPKGRKVSYCSKFNLYKPSPDYCKLCASKGEHNPPPVEEIISGDYEEPSLED